MTTTIKTTQLDFDNIKNALKSYLQDKDEFSDYNFEGSALNNIMDVLAYNTHVNGLIANFGINESFLNTAQLRSSVVSLAAAVGYAPRSRSASSATVNLYINIPEVSRPSLVQLPKGTSFSTEIEGTSYTFRTIEKYSATPNSNGLYQFKLTDGSLNLPIYEGKEKTKTFYVGEVDEQQVFVIPDTTIDTNTLEVKVYPTATSSESDAATYTDILDAPRITPDSTLYQIKEVPNGYYELIFGDGLATGKRPEAGNKIVVTYLSTKGPEGNGGTLFTPESTVSVEGFGNYTLGITTISESAGGDEKETMDSIRLNAPVAFASQQRLVTAEDYLAQVKAKYGNVLDDVISWGGADNVPPVYGVVYIGLKFKTGISTESQQATKDAIVSQLTDNLGIMSIETRFADVEQTFLELSCNFNFDPDLTTATPRATQNAVVDKMSEFFEENLSTFGSVFRRSNLLAEIDDIDVAILNSSINVKVQQRITPVLNKTLAYTLNFPMAIAGPDDQEYRISSGRFSIGAITCTLRNKLNTNKLEIVSTAGDVIIDNAGSYEEGSGKVNIVGFTPSSIDGGTDLKVSVVPANQSVVKPLRNYILTFDEAAATATATIDYQETSVSL
jgi:hypothetical protein